MSLSLSLSSPSSKSSRIDKKHFRSLKSVFEEKPACIYHISTMLVFQKGAVKKKETAGMYHRSAMLVNKICCHVWSSKIKDYSQNTHLGLKTPILVLRWPGDFSKGEFSFRAKESVLLKCTLGQKCRIGGTKTSTTNETVDNLHLDKLIR